MKKESIKKIILNAAWQIVETKGIHELNARNVAKLSNCALGSIYNAFENFQDLQLHIKANILSKLYEALITVTKQGIAKNKSLRLLIKDLGLTYIEFGMKNPSLWKALFETFPSHLPDWYKKHAQKGIYDICNLLAIAYDLTDSSAKRIVGFFWTSIHGISANLLNHKIDVVEGIFQGDYLNDYLDYCIEGLLNNEYDRTVVSHSLEK